MAAAGFTSAHRYLTIPSINMVGTNELDFTHDGGVITISNASTHDADTVLAARWQIVKYFCSQVIQHVTNVTITVYGIL